MQSKDPFLALLGLFILGTTFFFCGGGAVTSPPPVALDSQADIPPPAPNIIEPPPSPSPVPPVSAPRSAAMMSGDWICWFWTVVGAGLLGWGIKGVVLGPVMDQKRREVERLMSKVITLASQPPEVRTVEKRIEVPVERVVVKRVEVPVEKIVERPVDNPEQLSRIKALESEVTVIAGLLAKIAQLSAPSEEAGGMIVKEPAEALVEKVVEKVVERPVDNPEHLARIKALEDEVAVIAGLRAQIAELQAAASQIGEQVVEQRSKTPAEQIVVQNGEVPIGQVSAPALDLTQVGAATPSEEGQAGTASPDDLKQIHGVGPALERFLHKRGVFWFRQVATWSQADIDKFEFLLPNFSGRIQREHWVRSAQIEHYKKYQQWLGDGEPPSENADLPAQSAELQAGEQVVEQRIETPAETTGEVLVESLSEPAGDLDHAGGELPDDLKQIRGVGPALERFLHKRGVFWFRQVATWSQADIDKFEFLLPNFSGRIQREHWVRSAQIEHYKKYQQWLGDDEPPSESLNLPVQMAEHQAVSSVVEEKISEQAGNLDGTGTVEQSDEDHTGGESPDDLKQIRGVGPALERFLHKRGVFWFRQVATWSQADIDKFEFLLPNFSGRIQREHWVRSAQIEHYKKYQQWLGDGEPPSESLDLPAQSAERQAASSQDGEQVAEERIEAPAEQIVAQNGEVLVETISEPAGDLNHASAVEPLDEGQAGGASPDDLKQIRGVGPALERFLHKRGVFWFSQVATWSQADIDKFEFLLPNFSGRIQREDWVRSARVEYYKKHKIWLGDGEPPSTTPDTQ